MSIKSFTIIGGDLRSIRLADLMRKDGKEVNIFGFNSMEGTPQTTITEDLHNAIGENDVVIGPLPCSNDNETINSPFNNKKIFINDLFKTMGKNQLFIAGRISSKITHLARIYNVYCIDILDREEMAVLNAIPTAEGAIQIAMEELPITLHGSNALVLGFGRVAKILAKMLKGIGIKVYVGARKCSDIAWITGYDYEPLYINGLKNHISKMDVIFNTIPALILDENMLTRINKKTLIVDLASRPGGVDFEKARQMGLTVKWALSLPGKVAPDSAAKFIKDTIYNILEELGV